MSDARFEDSNDTPVRLRAFDADEVPIISSLVQDAVLEVGDMSYRDQKFGLLINRVRREVPCDPPERVRSVLLIENVLQVQSNGISRQNQDLILSLLAIEYHAGDDAMGEVRLIFAGDGELRLRVEALELVLRDVAQPHLAVSGKLPQHEI